MATLLSTDGTSSEVQPKGEAFTITELHGLIDGYLVFRKLPDARWMGMNDDMSDKQLPTNTQATTVLAKPGFTVGGPVVVLSAAEFRGLRYV